MLEYMIPLWVAWLPFWNAYMVPLFGLGFILFVVSLVRNVLRG